VASIQTSDVLIVGSGGREHALGWKISKSPHVEKIYYAPGNGGTAENLDIKQNDISALLAFALSRDRDLLTIIGPEEPLSLGIVDAFLKEGLKIFGPTAAAAKIEASKSFAKEFMVEAGIPTARFGIFTDPAKAKEYVSAQPGPVVVKADGLAAGKGVVVCDSSEQALAAVDSMMVRREFGSAGGKVVIEDRIVGEEASFIAMCDGEAIVPLASSQDHKRVFDGDLGPNTGGMGAYSPAPVIDESMYEQIVQQVMKPAISTMKKRGTPFVGFLYAGIMVEEKSGKPYVLEFNARMGDPECQPIMMRMESDLLPYVRAAVDGRLASLPPIRWSDRTAVCVVMAARGYPGNYEKGRVIEGLSSVAEEEAVVFHAGTSRDATGRVVTNSGRVLGVTAMGKDAQEAANEAYSAARRIRWGENGQHYRTDIAQRAIMRQK
jgi:phosphoribosylamine--glycine ligase